MKFEVKAVSLKLSLKAPILKCEGFEFEVTSLEAPSLKFEGFEFEVCNLIYHYII